MRRKRLALFLAVALAATSIDSSALMISAEDFTDVAAVTADVSEEESVSAEAEDIIVEEEPAMEEAEDSSAAESESEEEAEISEAEVTAVSEDSAEEAEITAMESETADVAGAVEEAAEEELLFTDAAADAAGDEDEDTFSLEDVDVTEMYDGYSGTVDITEGGQEVWFSYTPTDTGNYIFKSSGSSDPIVYFYDSRQEHSSEDEYDNSDDDGGDDNNFEISQTLTAGITYYYRTRMSSSSDTGSFGVSFYKAPDVSSATVYSADAPTTFYTGLGTASVAGAELTLTYSNKTSETITLSSYGGTTKYGNSITFIMQDDDNEVYSGNTFSAAGTYTVNFYCDGTLLEDVSYDIIVKKLTDSEISALPALSEGDNTIDSPADGYAWYTFTPDSTAVYIFRDMESMVIRCYDFDDDNGEKVWYGLSYNVSSWIDGSHICVYELTKGTTYYVGFSGTKTTYNEDDEDVPLNSFTVNIAKQKTVKSLSVSLTYDTLYISVDEGVNLKGVAEIGYSDGTNEECSFTDGDILTKNGNVISAYVSAVDTKETDADYMGTPGNYKAVFTCGEATAEVQFTVKNTPEKTEDFPTLEEGMTEISSRGYWLTPEMDGVYDLYVCSAAGRNEGFWYASVYQYSVDGELVKVEQDASYKGYSLEKGTKYLVWVGDEDEYPYVYVERYKNAVSMEILNTSPSSLEYYESLELVYLNSSDVRITWDDGSTTKKTLYDSTLVKKTDTDYEEVDNQYPEAGTYYFRVSYTDELGNTVYAYSSPVTVKSLEDGAKTIETGEETTVENDGNGSLLYTLDVGTAGRYKLTSNVPLYSITALDANKNSLDTYLQNSYTTYMDFPAGTCYLYLLADTDYSQLKITLTPVTKPASLKTTALKTKLIAGLDVLADDDLRTEVTREDGTTRTVSGAATVGGYKIGYTVTNTETNVVTGAGIGVAFPAGTWKITPDVKAITGVESLSGSAVEYLGNALEDVKVEGTEVTAEILDVSTLKTLTLDEWETISDQGYQRVLYAFTAPEDAVYEMESGESACENYFVFYYQGKDGLEAAGSSIELTEGQTCVVVGWIYTGLEIRVVKEEEEKEDPGVEGPVTLTDGYTGTLLVPEDGAVNCTFTPENDGWYIFESSADSGDPVCYLYESEDLDWLRYEDDDGENSNFRLLYKLEAGTAYTYKVKTYNGDKAAVPVSFRSVDTDSMKTIESARIVKETGMENVTLNPLLSLDYVYCIEVTYNDGTVARLSCYSTDSYGNYVEFYGGEKTGSDGSIAYSAYVEYKNWNADDFIRTDAVELPYGTARKIKDVVLVSAPDNTECTEIGSCTVVSLSGLKVCVSYTDGGADETITYGQSDSSGRTIKYVRAEWETDKTCTVYVEIAGYQVSFKGKAGTSASMVQVNKMSALPGSAGDWIYVGFTPEEDGLYSIETENAYVEPYMEAESSDKKTVHRSGDKYWLTGGSTYCILVYAYGSEFSFLVTNKDHSWTTVSNTATCVQDGILTESCSVHGCTRTGTAAATGQHTSSDWNIVKAATETEEGLRQKVCTVCGTVLASETIAKLEPAKSNTDGAGTETVEPAKSDTDGAGTETVEPTIKMSITAGKTVPMQVKQKYTVKVSDLVDGDSVVSWKSSKPKVATINKKGKIIAKKTGTTTITVTLKSGLTKSFKIKVQKKTVKTKSVYITSAGKKVKKLTLKKGKSLKLSTVVTPVTSQDKVTWSSSNKKVATVNSKGKVTAKKKGTVTITAKSGKKKYKIKITVK